jgi:plastocyanin
VFKVTDTKPIWVFCQQGSHCQAGMVFAINPGPGQFATFQATAMGAAPAPAPPTPSAGAGGTDHKVVVGGPGTLTYSPNEVQAQPGDTITFEFHQKNHTVTQSSFDDPCRKLDQNGVTGFDSGFLPVADGATDFPTWNFTVTDTAPVWAYCRQKTPASHCGAGMVFAINSDESSGRNFAAFQNVAKALNGTAAAASAPSATAAAGSGANSVKMGGISISLVFAAVIGSLL